MKGEDAATAIPISVPSPPPATVRVLMALLHGQCSQSLFPSNSLLLIQLRSRRSLYLYNDLDILILHQSPNKFNFERICGFKVFINSRVFDLVQELEQSEKVVRKMWDAYTEKPEASLRRFWQEAFEAAYEYLSSEVPGVRDAAVAEIAKLSVRSSHLSGHPTVGQISSFY